MLKSVFEEGNTGHLSAHVNRLEDDMTTHEKQVYFYHILKDTVHCLEEIGKNNDIINALERHDTAEVNRLEKIISSNKQLSEYITTMIAFHREIGRIKIFGSKGLEFDLDPLGTAFILMMSHGQVTDEHIFQSYWDLSNDLQKQGYYRLANYLKKNYMSESFLIDLTKAYGMA